MSEKVKLPSGLEATITILDGWALMIADQENVIYSAYGLPKPTEDIEHEVISTKINK